MPKHNFFAHNQSEIIIYRDSGWGPELKLLSNFLLLASLFVAGVFVSRWWEKRKMKKAGARAILADQDTSAGVEMTAAELYPDGSAEGAEAAGSSGAVASSGLGSDVVRDELTKLRLERYAEAFEHDGYDVWEEILRMRKSSVVFESAIGTAITLACSSDADAFVSRNAATAPTRLNTLITRVRMTPNHADRFRECLREQRRERSIAQLRGGGAADGAADEACVIL
jgi:hypothetical protein